MLSLDSFFYYGTDEFYLEYFVKFVRPGGQIGTVDPGLLQELPGETPEHLRDWPFTGWHTPEWWRGHWERTGIVEVEVSDEVPESAELFRRHEELQAELRPNSLAAGWRSGGR